MHEKLSRREREIMDILIAQGAATAEEIRTQLVDPPSSSAARATLSRLESKGYIEHREKGLRYVYSATVAPEKARESAAKRLVKVFYDGSFGKAVAGLVNTGSEKLSEDDLQTMEKAIAEARRTSSKRKRRP